MEQLPLKGPIGAPVGPCVAEKRSIVAKNASDPAQLDQKTRLTPLKGVSDAHILGILDRTLQLD